MQARSQWVHPPLVVLHLSPLFLLWGTQKSPAVNNSWNRRGIAPTWTVGLVLTEPLLSTHCCCASFYTSYSTPIAPVYSTCRHWELEPWGPPNAPATSTHKRPITTTSGCVTLKELLKPSRGTGEVSDMDIAQLQNFCFLLRWRVRVYYCIKLWNVSRTHSLTFPLFSSLSLSYLPLLHSLPGYNGRCS